MKEFLENCPPSCMLTCTEFWTNLLQISWKSTSVELNIDADDSSQLDDFNACSQFLLETCICLLAEDLQVSSGSKSEKDR